MFKFKTLKERYVKLMIDTITVSLDDLTDNERILIDSSYDLFKEKLEDIKILEDNNKRLTIELANLKASLDDSTNEYEE